MMNRNTPIQGFLFDYGGTLDTGGCHWGKMMWHAYARAGVPVSEQQFVEAYIHTERMLGKNTIVQHNDTFRETLSKKIQLQLDYLKSTESYHLGILDDLYLQVRLQTTHSREVLHQLKEHFPLALVSNFYGNMETALHEFGFEGIFLHVIESAVVNIRKPDPRIFLMGVEKLGLHPENVAVVGDSIKKDIVPAQQAGCQTVWLKGESWMDEPQDETIPDNIITDIKEILNIYLNGKE